MTLTPSQLSWCSTSYLSYFDSHGNYYARDDKDDEKDNWLDGVDWNKVTPILHFCCYV